MASIEMVRESETVCHTTHVWQSKRTGAHRSLSAPELCAWTEVVGEVPPEDRTEHVGVRRPYSTGPKASFTNQFNL